MVWLLQERLKLINSLLQKIVDENPNGVSFIENKKQEKNLKILCRVCSWHHDIIKLIALTNETFGLKTVVFFGFAFMVIVMQVFLSCQLFKREIQWKFLLEYLLAVASYSYTVYKICNICEYTVREAKRSGLLIHQIETEDFDMRDEIEMFSLQIANENIEFSSGGFFPIDYSLLFSIIGGVTTYIIILIQLDSSDPEHTVDGNTTAISSISLFSTPSY
ncbi:putative gustatory receptor 2a [Coccinella septempunctata]|uniref:putative gustatory receptor 2a n=1 Tax=Coccinella septempunctata TaxID=41139 RepID=UPI001D0682F4|nr:putative gustatory receptor 2a [Coccinella septempunctata]